MGNIGHAHACAPALVRQSVTYLFMYFPQVLKMAEWPLLTHSIKVCLYYSGWQSMYYPEHRGIHLCMQMDLLIRCLDICFTDHQRKYNTKNLVHKELH